MDPAVSAVLSAQSASTAQQVDFTVLRKQMDMQKDQGQQLVELIAQAATIDSSSGRVDVYA